MIFLKSHLEHTNLTTTHAQCILYSNKENMCSSNGISLLVICELILNNKCSRKS